MVKELFCRGERGWLWGAIAILAVFAQTGLLVPPASGSTPPEIEALGASEVTNSSAVLEATIDPVEGGAYYQFQIATSPSGFASEILCPAGTMLICEGTYAEEALPIGEVWGEAQSVELDLNAAGVKLEPGVTYYYRVLAARAADGEGDEAIEWEGPIVFAKSRSLTTEVDEEPSVPPMLDVPASSLGPGLLPPRPCKGTLRPNGKVFCARLRLPRFCRVSTAEGALMSSSVMSSRPKGVALLVKERTVPAGRRAFARLVNFGSTDVTYGRAFSIDRWTGDGWEEDPSSPDGPWPKALGRLASDAASACYVFQVPAVQDAGTYRFSTSVQLSPGTKRGLARRLATFKIVRN